MVWSSAHPRIAALAARQHGVVTRAQLVSLGLSRRAIEHRLRRGQLHLVTRGVYAWGRTELPVEGRWLAAVLTCGAGSLLSHRSAAALWGIREQRGGPIEISVPENARRRRSGLRVHRRSGVHQGLATRHRGIPVTTPALTLVDLALVLTPGELEAAVNEADKLDLVHPNELRGLLADLTRLPGAARLSRMLDRRTFALTDSALERRFLPLARRAGLPQPLTGSRVNGFKVDFHWPALGLVVETDGLRYHRTASQQGRDRLRDQVHAAAGLTTLRFTHAQVAHEPGHVEGTLRAVAARLARRSGA